MKVFVIGSGGKIHSLLWKLAQSERVAQLFSTYSNIAISRIAEFVDIRENETDKLLNFIEENKIDLTIIDSLTTGAKGLGDKLSEKGLNFFGPTKNTCKIAMNKGFTKKFLYKNKIPTPQFGVFDKEAQAISYARNARYPQVVKFDSRVPGSGSIICKSFNEARNAITFCLKNLFKPVVLENYVSGRHISFQVITDGYNAVPLPVAYVYKESETGGLGINTEGMGAYAPVSYVNEEVEAKIGEKLFFPLIDGLNKEKMGFAGVLKADIIIDDKNNPNVVGIDVNFGDPETQTVLPLLNEDLFDVMMLTSAGALADSYDSFSYNNNYSVCVNLVSDGYPGEYKKGVAIEGLDEIDDDNTLVFHAGTKKNIYAEIITDGPKVIDVVSTASTLSRAHELVYEAANQIDYQNIKYRTDIAKNKVLLDIK